MQAVMASIRPCYCADIANLIKTIEIRKSSPRLETPFKCYIYCTKGPPYLVLADVFCGNWETEYATTHGYSREEADRIWGTMNSKVIGEFVCDDCSLLSKEHYGYIEKHGRLSARQLKEYMGIPEGRELEYSDGCYGWHISELVIYDTPKELSDFYVEDIKTFDCPSLKRMKRPPQSWCYVEGLAG